MDAAALQEAKGQARRYQRVATEAMRLLDELGQLPELKHRLDALEGDGGKDDGGAGGGNSS